MSTIKRGLGASGSFDRMQKRSIAISSNGVMTITEIWQCPKSLFLSLIPAYQDVHPTYTSCYCTGEITGEEINDINTFTVVYSGYDNGDGAVDPDDVPPRYWFDGVDKVQPITYLNRGSKTFAALVASTRALGLEPLDSKNRFVNFPLGAQSPNGDKIDGLTDFMQGNGAWNCERFASSAPSLSDACKLDASPPGGAPSLSSGYSWLYLTPSYEKLSATLFHIKETWIIVTGNTDIYESI